MKLLYGLHSALPLSMHLFIPRALTGECWLAVHFLLNAHVYCSPGGDLHQSRVAYLHGSDGMREDCRADRRLRQPQIQPEADAVLQVCAERLQLLNGPPAPLALPQRLLPLRRALPHL